MLNTSTVSVLQPASEEDYYQAIVVAGGGDPGSGGASASMTDPVEGTVPSPGAPPAPPSAFEIPCSKFCGSPCPFPWLRDFFAGLFDPPEQLDYFHAWLKRWYKSALDERMLPGQASFFAGVPNTGKPQVATACSVIPVFAGKQNPDFSELVALPA